VATAKGLGRDRQTGSWFILALAIAGQTSAAKRISHAVSRLILPTCRQHGKPPERESGLAATASNFVKPLVYPPQQPEEYACARSPNPLRDGRRRRHYLATAVYRQVDCPHRADAAMTFHSQDSVLDG
jgi:hypothetical protein